MIALAGDPTAVLIIPFGRAGKPEEITVYNIHSDKFTDTAAAEGVTVYQVHRSSKAAISNESTPESLLAAVIDGEVVAGQRRNHRVQCTR